jgi:class 3 adenylate cyclase
MPRIDPFTYPKGKKQPKYYDVTNVVCFFDVVGFTKHTTNQDMKKMIKKIEDDMEELLWEDYNWNELRKRNDLILISTGDGYGIGFHPSMNNDKILSIVVELYKRLVNGKIFDIRIGIAKGPNIRHIDWNEKVNLFGYGTNLASRVTNLAAPNQILIHSDYAEELTQIKSMPDLQKVDEPQLIKHGESIVVYNYYREGQFGVPLN